MNFRYRFISKQKIMKRCLMNNFFLWTFYCDTFEIETLLPLTIATWPDWHVYYYWHMYCYWLQLKFNKTYRNTICKGLSPDKLTNFNFHHSSFRTPDIAYYALVFCSAPVNSVSFWCNLDCTVILWFWSFLSYFGFN